MEVPMFRKKTQQAPETISSEEALSRYDKESATRHLHGPAERITFLLAVCWSLFQLYTAIFGTFPSTIQRGAHIGAAMMLVYLLYPMRKGKDLDKVPWYDYILCIISLCVGLYHVVNFDALQLRSGIYNTVDTIVSVVALLLILEATRRVAGLVIVCLALIFLSYALFGAGLPGFLGHAQLSFKRIVTYQWLSTEAILGSPMYVSSTFIFLFLLFATFLKKSGVGDWMTNIAMSICGGAAGGPAKAAVVASALEGMLSGSSVANTVGSGSITIPMMKKCGYKPEFAGAVEAAASTGGQIMPPIMGAAAFIMAEYIGCAYSTIALAACIPALLYFTGIFTNVHFEALKNGLRGVPKEQRPKIKELWKNGWYMLLPIVFITVLMGMGYTAMRAATYGIASCIVIWIIELYKSHRLHWREFLSDLFSSLEEGARTAVPVAITCGSAGIIVGVITLTGLGLRMANGIVDLAGGNLLLTMVFTMCCSLVLGMGVPTTANYIIQATISAPAMIALGVEPIAAHLFVFYFGIVADITPPVALAAFAGAGIAGADPMKTGLNASKLGCAAYLVPYIFCLSPELVLVIPAGMSTALFALSTIKAIITAIIGMLAIAGCTSGYLVGKCNILERIVLLVAGLTLIDPGTFTDLIGVIILAAIYVEQKMRLKKGLLRTAV